MMPNTAYRPHPSEGQYEHNSVNRGTSRRVVGSGNVPIPPGDDNMYHQYRVTITPYLGAGMVKISIKEFHDGALPSRNVYTPLNIAHKPNGREQLRLAVARDFVMPGAESTFSCAARGKHTGP